MSTVKKLLEDPGALRKWLAEDMESEFQAMPDPEAMLMGGPKFAAAWMGISDKCTALKQLFNPGNYPPEFHTFLAFYRHKETLLNDAMTKKHDLNERAIAVAAEGPSVHTPRQGSSVRVWPKTPTKKGRQPAKQHKAKPKTIEVPAKQRRQPSPQPMNIDEEISMGIRRPRVQNTMPPPVSPQDQEVFTTGAAVTAALADMERSKQQWDAAVHAAVEATSALQAAKARYRKLTRDHVKDIVDDISAFVQDTNH